MNCFWIIENIFIIKNVKIKKIEKNKIYDIELLN
jgi:hypothetical protein